MHVALRAEYVDLYMDWILARSVERQFTAFKSGFDAVVTSDILRAFHAEELEQLVCGSRALDFEELQRVTTYDEGYISSSGPIRDFWACVHAFSPEQKRRLLAFVTGSDRVPIGGLAKMPFKIVQYRCDLRRLPTSHTCFNTLILPPYSSRTMMRDRLLTAIQNAEGFGLR